MDVHKLFTSAFSRLANIPRFSIYSRLFNESVAEHSYYVTVFCVYLWEMVPEMSRPQLPLGDLLVCALLHDLDEAYSGDINGPFKHDLDAATRRIINKAGEVAVSTGLHEIDAAHYSSKMSNSVSHIGQFIIKLADFMSLIMFVSRENDAGNKRFMQEVDLGHIKRRLRWFEDNDVGFVFNRVIVDLRGIAQEWCDEQ